MKQGDISEFAQALGVSLEPSQVERLLQFEDLLRDRAIPAGMVAAGDTPLLRERHILDSLRAAAPEVAGPASVVRRRFADLGSGAGLPGIVLAIALPGDAMTLIEKRPKRAAFLELAVRELALANTDVSAGTVDRLREVGGEPFDGCFARAFMPLERAWEVAVDMLRPAGRLVYFAGAKAAEGPDGVESVEKSAKVVFEPCSLLESAGPLVIMTRK